MVTYRLATENDYKNINNFHNRIYQNNRTISQFYWEFHNCPFGKSIYVIAIDNDKIVGTNCVIPIIVTNSNGDMIKTGKSEDTLVDPEYRGQNIFNNIYEFLFKECANNGIKIIWGFTSAKKPFQKIGFKTPFDHQQSLIVNSILGSYRYLSVLNQNNGLKQKTQILALCILSKLKSLKGEFITVKTKLSIEENTIITDNVSELIESYSIKNPSLFYIFQNKEFQHWRIYDNPNYHKIHTFGAYDVNKKLVALIILNSHPNGVAYVIQSSFDSSVSFSEKTSLLNYTTKSMFKKGITLIRNWHFDNNQQNKEEIDVFKKANFLVLKKGISFVWKEIDHIQLNPNNFLLSRISTQGVI